MIALVQSLHALVSCNRFMLIMHVNVVYDMVHNIYDKMIKNHTALHFSVIHVGVKNECAIS